jgi:Bacterial Ig-like domain (group 3)/Autotransporter beta-domain
MPAGLVLSNAPGTACGGTVTVGGGGTSISLTAGTLAANSSCTFTVTITGTSAGVKTNTTGTVSSNEGGVGNVATATITVNGTGASTTTTALTSSANPSNVGQSVTFTVKVTSGGGTPSGTVNFADGGTLIATMTLTAGSAAFTISSLAVGTHPITANYGGSGSFAASASPTLTQTVQGSLDSTRLRSLQLVVNKLEAQASGSAFDGAVSGAIADGFNDGGGALITPNGNGVRFNFAADPETTARSSGRVADQYDSVSATRAAMLGNSGPNDLSQNGLPPSVRSFAPETPPASAGRVDDAFAALAFDKPVVTKAPPLPPAPKVWLLWADVRGTGWDTSAAAGDIRGGQINAILGLTRKLSPDLLVGILAGYENFDYTSQTLNGRLRGDGWTAGAYLGWRIWPGVRLDAAVGRSGVSYDGASGAATASFPGTRWIGSGGVTGMYRLEVFEIEPSARVYAVWEHDSAYTDSLGTPQTDDTFTTGRASAGAKVTYPMAWVVNGTLAPYVGLYADYYFSSENAVLLLPTDFVRGWAARTTAGVGYTGASGVKASVGGEVGGLGSQNFTVWSVRGRLSLPF